jgi:hypothetical protein
MKKSLRNLGLTAAFSLLGTAAFADVLKTPYIIYEMPNTTMTVLWQDTAVETTNIVSWGTDTSYALGTSGPVAEETRPGTVNQHYYKITGLQPNTRYYYKVEDAPGGTVYGTGSFLTAPDENVKSVKFVGQGDSRSQPFALNNLMKSVAAFSALPGNDEYSRLAIANGDWVNSDADSNWVTEWFDKTKTDIRAYTANTPMDGCKGNHDNSSGYTTYFTKYMPFPYVAKTLKAGTTATWNNLYWSMDYGPVHVVYLDQYSSYAPGSAQYNWLVSDLAATAKPWKIVVHHASAYSAGSDGDDTGMRALESVFAANNVDFLWSGHSHNYARAGVYTTSQANGDNIALNLPHITSGGGGAGIYQPDLSNAGNWPHVITAWPAFEFMTFDVQDKTLTMTAYQATNVSKTAISPLSSTFPACDGDPTKLCLEKIETTVLNHFNNVSPQISATTGNFVYNRATKLYTGNLTITNNGADLTGKLHVVLDGILNLQGIGTPNNMYSTKTPKITSMIATKPATGKNSTDPGLMTTVTLSNATGSQNGQPMIQTSASGLASGASITVPLTFSNPTNAKITFNPITYQE